MPMSPQTLGDAMHSAWNGIQPDEATYNKLGDKMYDRMLEIIMDQESSPAGDLGRYRFRKMARAMLEEFYNSAGSTSKNRWIAVAEAIINHIKSNATIKPINTDGGILTGTPPHQHFPVTLISTGKIF